MPKQPRPCIGINADFMPAGKQTHARFQLHHGYVDTIAAAGGLPIVVPPFGHEPIGNGRVDLDAYLDLVDGFVLTGSGLDLDPRKHGLPMSNQVQVMPERRDESDRYLVAQIIERRLPVLAIGVGMQQLNVALGGTLILHLPEEMPRALPHRDPSGQPHRHTCLIEPGTRMEEIYGPGEIRVNSAHHQAVRQPGSGLQIAARSPDGVIEAIEATDPAWFCFGVQWHPETDTASALDLQLIEAFLQACLRQAPALRLAA